LQAGGIMAINAKEFCPFAYTARKVTFRRPRL
jgi:hypothetical protein